MKLTVTLTALAMAGSVAITQGTDPADALATWMVVEHEVADFDHWHETFEAALPIRRSVGELSHHIRRDAAHPERLIVTMKWDTEARARSFVRDPILANGMRAAGVIDGVRIWICGAANAPTAAATSPTCDMVKATFFPSGTVEISNIR